MSFCPLIRAITSHLRNELPAIAAPPGSEKDERWLLVTRILQSPSFSRSARLPEVLRYIAVKTLEGSIEDLSEYQIGTRVFGRPAHYSPGDDSIVRSQARLYPT